MLTTFNIDDAYTQNSSNNNGVYTQNSSNNNSTLPDGETQENQRNYFWTNTNTIGIPPHGGELVDHVLRGEAREVALERAKGLVQVPLSRFHAADLEMIVIGAYSPLTGFMDRVDYDSVVEEMRLDNGLVWSIPITLDIPDNLSYEIEKGQEIALVQGDRIMAVMTVTDKFDRDRQQEARQVYGTDDVKHSGVKHLYQEGDTLLGGDVWLLNWPDPEWFPRLRGLTPARTRQKFAENKWNRIVGFQTRNPLNRGHEYILKHALEITDGLFLHPLVGETKPDDISAEARIKSYRTLLQNYYPLDRVLLGVFPAAMRFAGPREAIFHALCRKNYGCTHFIVGRDHAGVGNYYSLSAACDIFKELCPKEIGIEILPYPEIRYYCPKCDTVASFKMCPHHRRYAYLNGSQIRQILAQGKMPPKEVMRPEVSGVLLEEIFGRKPISYFVHRAIDTVLNEPQEFMPRLKAKLKRWCCSWFKKLKLQQTPKIPYLKSS